MQRDPIVLLSVRPRFASALLDGSKTAEVRRRRARISDGTLCLVYASSPTCALVGAIRVATTDCATPDALWARHGDAMGLDRGEYDAYLSGSSRPCAILVGAVTAFEKPVYLSELRRRYNAFVAPQSYRFLPEHEAPSLLNGQLRQVERLGRVAPHRTALSTFGPSTRKLCLTTSCQYLSMESRDVV